MRIAVDIDDTLNAVDRVRYAGEYIRRKNLPFRLVDENAHMLEKVYDWSHDDVLEFVHDGGITAFTDAPARKGAREVLERWRTAGIEVIVLTSRVAEWFGNPEKLSRDWLEKRHIPYDGLVASCADKGAYCAQNNIDILIDDSVEQCLSAQGKGVYAVLAVSRATLERAREVHYGGANWKQIDAAVAHIAGLMLRAGTP
ncbi:MAG TPA: hypothetical protein H9676_00650 [Firmicutes bacterium]|nr:hypothetical protein [Bacillota bacterium]